MEDTRADPGQLKAMYPHVSMDIIRYLLEDVAAGNMELASDMVGSLTEDQISSFQIPSKKKKLSESEKQVLSEFQMIAGAPRKVCLKFLTNNSWSLEGALNSFFNSGYEPEESSGGGNDITEVFEKYKRLGVEEGGDESVDAIQGMGLVKLGEDLGVDAEKDPILLVLAWLLGSKTAYEFSREEFVDGLEDLGVTSFAEMKDALGDWRKETEERLKFRDFYMFVFKYLRGTQKSLSVEVATSVWPLIMKDYPVQDWCTFIRDEYKKAVSLDTWSQFLDFSLQVKPDLSDYDLEGGAWPSVLDEYVRWWRAAHPAVPEQ